MGKYDSMPLCKKVYSDKNIFKLPLDSPDMCVCRLKAEVGFHCGSLSLRGKDTECMTSWLGRRLVFCETRNWVKQSFSGLSLSSTKNRRSFQLLTTVAMGTVSNKYTIRAGRHF